MTSVSVFSPTVGESASPSPDIPALPRDLCIPDETGKQVAPPDLTLGGAPLIVSNAPETIDWVPESAALYRTGIASQRFRVFFHHQNGTKGPLQIGIAITYPARARGKLEIYLSRNSQDLPEQALSTVSPSPASAGMAALRNWFISRTDPPQDVWLHTLSPGETRYILQTVPSGDTVTGMYDFALDYIGGSRDDWHYTYVTVLACDSPPRDPTALPVLPPEKGPWHRRGTFAHSDRYGRVECDASQVRWLDIAGPESGKYSRLMKNELETATDDPKGLNPGNYGVVYNLKVSLRNTADKPVDVRCLLSAAGGAGRSGIALDGAYREPGKPLEAYESWVFKIPQISSTQPASFRMRFSLPGGCSGAHRLFFWPRASDESRVESRESRAGK